MNANRKLHDLGQSLWLDNITRNLLKTGVLRRYIDELSVTGLTSNPTIFDHAIKNGNEYDDAIKKLENFLPSVEGTSLDRTVMRRIREIKNLKAEANKPKSPEERRKEAALAYTKVMTQIRKEPDHLE